VEGREREGKGRGGERKRKRKGTGGGKEGGIWGEWKRRERGGDVQF